MPTHSPPTATWAAQAVAEAAKIRHEMRGQLCVGPKHPGHPSEYRVSISAKCVAAQGEALRSAKALRRVRREARAFPTDAQTGTEIRQLERALVEAPPDLRLGKADGGRTMEVSFRVLAELIDPVRRLRTTDPVERYNATMTTIQRTPGNNGFNIKAVQRRMVYRVALEHLRASLARPIQSAARKRHTERAA
jgi:hypothetical protein